MDDKIFLDKAMSSILVAKSLCQGVSDSYVRGVISGLHSAAVHLGFLDAASELMRIFKEECE